MTILTMSLGGSVLIAAVLLHHFLLNRLPKWTFLLLWGVVLCRLLIPFSLPSRFSVYTGAAWIAQALEQAPPGPAEEQTAAMLPPAFVPGTVWEDIRFSTAAPTAPALEREPAFPFAAIYLTGCALCGLFFVLAYGVGTRRFGEAEPIDSDFISRWQEEHPTLLPVRVRTCAAVRAPLAYGLVRPVILLPKNTDWNDKSQLTYVLTHEYVHIRRGDMLWKLLLTAAVCVHWFNPLVWAMYLRANWDLELACDEAVVHILGLDSRKGYACALLSAAESGFSPLCITYATKNHMEERIRAIMKMKKRSAVAVIAAVLLVTGITAVFATSPKPPEPQIMENLPQAVIPDPKPDQADKNDLPGGAAVPGEASFIWPLPQEYQKISFPFTERVVHPATGKITDHPGIDVAAPKGTPVCAAKSGVVTRSERDTTYGNLVELSHSDGSATLYAHLSERAVEVGQAVKQGEAIGTVGATGSATGPVLHFGIFADGSPVDPAEQLKAADAPTEAPREPTGGYFNDDELKW